MGVKAKGKAVDADTGKTLYTMEILEGRGSHAAKYAAKYGYKVVDFQVSFWEPDVHHITFFLRKMEK